MPTLPFDVALGLRLLREAGTIAEIADELAVVPSQVHASLGRLRTAGLLKAGSDRSIGARLRETHEAASAGIQGTGLTQRRKSNPRTLAEFILFGVRYAFPAGRGELAYGIPTAYSAPPLAPYFDPIDVVVWPAPRAHNCVCGFSIKPLYRGAPKLVERSPELYRQLTLVDALRIGDPKTRSMARRQLEIDLGWRNEVADQGRNSESENSQ